MQRALIHFKLSAKNHLEDLGLKYQESNGELDAIVDDVDYDPDHYFGDPDEQLCDHYGIEYDLVNCIEAV